MAAGGAVPIGGLESVASRVNIPETILQDTTQIQPDFKIGNSDFGNILNLAVQSINETQINADIAIKQLAAGHDVELHNVMLAVEKASMTLQLALQIKNKITDAYHEVMRMQI
ncbi:MAG TPA: flagellar hook-basal body complex protein FliE [Firmicutes bacterium]|nr:flagellar hook-basal body complex protein FliE [Bacillota bacterium]